MSKFQTWGLFCLLLFWCDNLCKTLETLGAFGKHPACQAPRRRAAGRAGAAAAVAAAGVAAAGAAAPRDGAADGAAKAGEGSGEGVGVSSFRSVGGVVFSSSACHMGMF